MGGTARVCAPGTARPRPSAGGRCRANHQPVFVDRVLITLVYLRLKLPHAALAELCGVTGPTVTRAIHEIRPLPARRGFAVPQRPGARLHTLAGSPADSTQHEVSFSFTRFRVLFRLARTAFTVIRN
ncbi:transposase family protein [Streptomyces sp. NPDC001222]|uniref:transposase family protein n=1 Tax=Streptomyces sp. NPDC001222 TaxID=3364548 RepID=UPI0036BA98F8